VSRAVASDDQEVLDHDRPGFAALAAGPDPARQVHVMAGLVCQIQERSESMQVAQREAPQPTHPWPTVWTRRTDSDWRRSAPSSACCLKPGSDPRRRRAPTSPGRWPAPRVFLSLRRVLGRTWPEIRSWLSGLLVDVLLVAQPSDVNHGARTPN
jgi:hypothetical protein